MRYCMVSKMRIPIQRMHTSRTPCYTEECMGRDQWADQRSAGSIMSETTAKSRVSLWRKQINWQGTVGGGGVVLYKAA